MAEQDAVSEQRARDDPDRDVGSQSKSGDRSGNRSSRAERLQRCLGNQAVKRLAREGQIQRRGGSSTAPDGDAAGPTMATDDLEGRIERKRGSGRSLPDPERSFFEERFGRDFGDVTVHHDAGSDELARSLDADAFTTGSDVFFREGQYQPGTTEGRSLLAHELTHVVQQEGGAARKIQRQSSSASGGGSSSAGGSGTSGGSSSAGGRQSSAPRASFPGWHRQAASSGGSSSTSYDIESPMFYDWTVSGVVNGNYKDGDDRAVLEGGKLYIKGKNDQRKVAPDDVKQLYLGNCYFLATLKAFAQQRPEVIENMIDEVSGGYEVTFYKLNGMWAPPYLEESYEAATVFVDDRFVGGAVPPEEEGRTTQNKARASGRAKAEIWMKVLEKAWAIHLGMEGEVGLGEKPDETQGSLGGVMNSVREAWKQKVEKESGDEKSIETIKAMMKNSQGAQGKRWKMLGKSILGQAPTSVDLGTVGADEFCKQAKAALDSGAPVVAQTQPIGPTKSEPYRYPLSAGAHAYWIEDATRSSLTFRDPKSAPGIKGHNKSRKSALPSGASFSDTGVYKLKQERTLSASELSSLSGNKYHMRLWVYRKPSEFSLSR